MFRQLIIFLSIIISCYAVKYGCSCSCGTCTISGIQVNPSDYKIEPVALNPLEVTKLVLRGNIPVLAGGFCEALPNLKQLEATSVSMEEVKNFTFLGCEKLEEINMEENIFKNIEVNSFKGLKKLKTLRLNSGNIPVFDVDLSDSIAMQYLSLSALNITVFPSSILRGKNQLETVFFYSNNLFDLDVEGILEQTTNLKEIYLADNNFKCDRIKKIKKLLKKRNIKIVSFYWSKYLRERGFTPENIDGIHCLSDMHWSHLFLIPQLQSKLEAIKANNEEKIINFTKTIEKLSMKYDEDQMILSKKHDVDLVKLTKKMEEEKENIKNILTKEFDEKLKNEKQNKDDKILDLFKIIVTNSIKHDKNMLKLSEKHDEDLLNLTDKIGEETKSIRNVLMNQFDEKLKSEKQNNDGKILNLSKTIETLSKKHDEDLLKLEEEKKIMRKHFDEKLKNERQYSDEKILNLSKTIETLSTKLEAAQQNLNEKMFNKIIETMAKIHIQGQLKTNQNCDDTLKDILKNQNKLFEKLIENSERNKTSDQHQTNQQNQQRCV